MLNKRTYQIPLIVLMMLVGFSQAIAREAEPTTKTKVRKGVLAEGCSPATSEADLDINNVRTLILGSGDFWWDLNNARYEVPKGSGKNSMFAGALWLGGIDEADQLKLAAMTYRSRGVDYWPGPLSDDNTASVTEATCQKYNRHWTVFRSEVQTHASWIECKEDPNCNPSERFPGYEGNIPTSIQNWPGNGVDGELPNKLAPYFESDTNGTPGFYEPEWDYPGYDLYRQLDCRRKEVDILYGDQTVWWVYNDKGNVHSETQAGALGFEIRAQAFAFTSNDEINNMTFNNYRIINKSTFTLADTYFGTWFDPDLGNHLDDIIGSDIARGLGYCYNGDNNDEGANGYGINPPAIGFDFFQGPFADYFDGLDNDRDGCIDGVRDEETGLCVTEDPATGVNERIIMSGFMYYNNGTSAGNPAATSDPSNGQEFYNYLQSKWKDGRNLVIETPSGPGNTANGDGYSNDASLTPTRFAYPGISFDTTGAYEPSQPIDWWESPNNQADKRGLHCAGPFSLLPGALNFITTGNVWARNQNSSDLFASVNDVLIADDKAQQLFDNCFEILDGPASPDIEIVSLDKKLVINFLNPYTSNTVLYKQDDPLIPPQSNWNLVQEDSARQAGYFSYIFEGFQIFQVSSNDIGVDQLYDTQYSRLIAQSDIKNEIGQLINYAADPDLEGTPLVPTDMTLEANNEGIQLSYTITEDAFAEDDRRLINNKEYYFYVVAYAQNQYIKFNPNLGDNQNAQKEPYLAGRDLGNEQQAYVGIPYKTNNQKGGSVLNADVGDEVQITRLNGSGTNGTFLELTNEQAADCAINFSASLPRELDYKPGAGPIKVTVVDPFEVAGGDYTLTFTGDNDTSGWVLNGTALVDPIESQFAISFLGEQIIEDLGVAITLTNPEREPGRYDAEEIVSSSDDNGFIGATKVYEDATQSWLGGVEDNDAFSPINWILAGSADASEEPDASYNDAVGDPRGVYETILNGTWAPVALTSDVELVAANETEGFGVRNAKNGLLLSNLPSVDVVITKDPSLWTRVPVLEMGNAADANQGSAPKYTLRRAPSMDKDGQGGLMPSATDSGWSYFPGYAIDVETGQRLNMAFGEASNLRSEDGDDMIWNPSDALSNSFTSEGWVLGGMHVIYVFTGYYSDFSGYTDISYKGDNPADNPMLDIINNLERGSGKRDFFNRAAWASIPVVNGSQYQFSQYADIPTGVTVSLRVENRFKKTIDEGPNDGFPIYQFSLDGYAADTANLSAANEALDLIKVVPNPYYGSSEYEDSQLDNIVKITNLPRECNINIYTTNGTLVRNIRKDNSATFVEWDLNNDFNVPIASGIYIVHIDAGEIGEKVVKWIGSIRPVDLNAF